ncbi:hypothetical protein DSO57_1014466 [Entomophthora muscae]|uniref:Uncharacterized protein n=1 Tax=Entomophthora muscae TaxID=34485 RepID=A0ACC2RWR7_9FUNG|nr:hypothetical protein DSO57_1014466 [Entomophthora muscae]
MLPTRLLPVAKPLYAVSFQHRVFIVAKSALACTTASMETVIVPSKYNSSTHEEHHNKPPSSSHPPSSPGSSSSGEDSKPRPDYFPGFCHAPAGPWNPFVAHNIFNVDGRFEVPSSLLNYSPTMSVKGELTMVANGYIYSSSKANQSFTGRHYTCEGCSGPVWLNPAHWGWGASYQGQVHLGRPVLP